MFSLVDAPLVPLAAMSAGVRTALLALLALLVVIFGCLIAFAFVIRRRPGISSPQPAAERDDDDIHAPAHASDDDKSDYPSRPLDAGLAIREHRGGIAVIGTDRAGGHVGGRRVHRPLDIHATSTTAGVDESQIKEPVVCPMCTREFDGDLRYCPHDATRLVSTPALLAHATKKSKPNHICPACRRVFDASVRYCPHDGADLLPVTMSRAISVAPEHHSHDDDDPDEIGKICPECRVRYRYGVVFCGKDGVELVVLN